MVHFVGAGPGAPDLITIRGSALLKEADIVIYAGSLINPAVLGLCREGARLYDSARLSLPEIIEIIEKAEKEGAPKSIVRLHSGDPGLYGAIREQIEALKERGIEYDLTPGVSSFNAAASVLETEYTVPGASQSVIITRMEGRTPVPVRERLKKLASHGASMVIFLSMGLVKEVEEELLSGGGYREDTPAAIVYKATWKEEKVIRCRLSELSAAARENGITSTALMIIGDFLGDSYERSRLYDDDFSTAFRDGRNRDGIRVIAFTDKGEALAKRLCAALCKEGGSGGLWAESGNIAAYRCTKDITLDQFVKRNFYEAQALVFIGAAGIAVRAVAPYIKNKALDPAIIVIDENGENVIPILSGHLGGGNELSKKIAGIIEGRTVITTATDINGCFSVDTWALEQGLYVINPEMIKKVSSSVLSGKKILFESIFPITKDGRIRKGFLGKPEGDEGIKEITGRIYRYIYTASGFRDAGSDDMQTGAKVKIDVADSDMECLKLCPRSGVLGIGCRKGVSKEQVRTGFNRFLKEKGLFRDCIQEAASIDLKKDEEGLLEFCREEGLKIRFFSADELKKVPGEFSSSDFVKETTGVDCVCERSAALASGGIVYAKKFAEDGVTFALAL